MKWISLVLFTASLAAAQSLSGSWDATLKINGVDTPFQLEIGGDAAHQTGTLFNGDDRFTSTSGTFVGGNLTLAWDYYRSEEHTSELQSH